MNQLATKLQKMKEYEIATSGGYVLAAFQQTQTYNGARLFRLHFNRKGNIRPTSFDVSIQFDTDFVVDYKDRDQDTIRTHFPDFESVVNYLTTQ